MSPYGTVHLEEEEFNDVYALLKLCIASEMGLDVSRVPEDAEFVESCRRILSAGEGGDSPVMKDMDRGFVPLFERLHKAKCSPTRSSDGVFYNVEF